MRYSTVGERERGFMLGIAYSIFFINYIVVVGCGLHY